MSYCARVFVAVVVSLIAVPSVAPADPADREGRGPAFSTGDPGSGEALPAPASEAEEEQPAVEEHVTLGGFCGGGPDSPLDEVQSLLDENRPAMARARLGQVLRAGLADWERPRGFAMAGEIALRLGAAARAVAWYREAVAVSEEPADPTARLGYAVALLRAGRRADASREAAALLGSECAEDAGGGDPMTCYGARLVAGLSAPTGEARAVELERASEIRTSNPDYDEMFVDFQRLLPGLARATIVRFTTARAD